MVIILITLVVKTTASRYWQKKLTKVSVLSFMQTDTVSVCMKLRTEQFVVPVLYHSAFFNCDTIKKRNIEVSLK